MSAITPAMPPPHPTPRTVMVGNDGDWEVVISVYGGVAPILDLPNVERQQIRANTEYNAIFWKLYT